jgi:hypothetical protein
LKEISRRLTDVDGERVVRLDISLSQWDQLCGYLGVYAPGELNALLPVVSFCHAQYLKKMANIIGLPRDLVSRENIKTVLGNAWRGHIMEDLGKKYGIEQCSNWLDLLEGYALWSRAQPDDEPVFL